ncbi:glutamyl-tRNA reductase [Helicobacter sp. MIT 03-1614]|uniref:glutamyl-tRNA reductase n=1 Tax=Helicobacter sp. MIT 03-1614 TaxID=1548147 RepID=UPI00068B9660|nr:glutamyl-tRNA reductase [Helicobacter sp. MIT 03-1614]TLD90661.1 glutamyl-tRNA reductase [Helicobacter sp. MIT 03-1614]
MQEKMEVQYMVVSFSHKNVDIATREKLSFSQEEIVPFLQEINVCDSIRESILLCTCNRVELYVSMIDKKRAREHIYECFCTHKNIALEDIKNIALMRLNQYAIYHIFSVASSLDSLVIGETQITGQLKLAYKLAFENALCAKDMTRLMHFAFKCAASVRKETDISAHSVSVASTAVRMAEQKLALCDKTLENLPVLVIGSGEMGRLACKHLQNANAQITLVSRTKENARKLALELDSSINIESWEHLEQLLGQYEVLFSATSAPNCIIQSKMVQVSQKQRWWFDLALPRDIEIIQMENLHIFCVDDLEEIVQEHKNAREDSAKKAQKILERYSVEFFKWLQTLGIDPIIKHIRYLAKQSALKELDRAVKKGFLPASYQQNVEKILHGAFNTFLHQPTIRLKQASENPQGDPIIEAMKNVFDISDDVVMLNGYKCEKDTIF